MRRTVLAATALLVFGIGMTASMAQQLDPGTIKVNPPVQTPPSQVQTQPSQPMNLNTSQNPYRDRQYLQTPVQQPAKQR
jgi:Tfp pilus assembly PilM family ATPase